MKFLYTQYKISYLLSTQNTINGGLSMPLAQCLRCKGNGHSTDQNPTRPSVHDWCAGCGGTEYA